MPWPRRPCTDPPALELFRDEDRFECHLCRTWAPWRLFTMGFDRRIATFDGFTEELERDPDHRHACNLCVKRVCWYRASEGDAAAPTADRSGSHG
jgi:hypothetical protein